MPQSAPKLEQWKALYEAGEAFRALEPWKTIHESEMFGVQIPGTDTVAYCAVMGGGAEHFGMAIYVGTEGFASYLRLMAAARDNDDDREVAAQLAIEQNCLLLTYERKGELDSEDLRLLNKAGIKPKGRQSWPYFRSMKPFSVPWPLNASEAHIATVALQQARDIVSRFKGNPAGLVGTDEAPFLVRVPEETENGIVWADQWPPFPEPPKDLYRPHPVDPERLRQIFSTAKRTASVWELAYIPIPVEWPGDIDERPYLTFVLIVADQKGLPLSQDTAPADDYEEPFADHIIALIEKLGIIPAEIQLVQPDLYIFLNQWATALQIGLVHVEGLPTVDAIVERFLDKFESGEE